MSLEPHASQPILAAGAPLTQARAAVVMIHGRGADAASILELSREFDRPDLAYLAPQAAGFTWYPNRFLMPVAANEPWLTSALARVGEVVGRLGQAGIPPERTALLGFSQGACLALEFAARHPQRYGAVIGLSGALIENGDRPRDYAGSLAGTPIFLGCSDVDAHVPRERVERSADVLRGLGADLTLRLYPNMDHTVNADEIRFVRGLLALL